MGSLCLSKNVTQSELMQKRNNSASCEIERGCKIALRYKLLKYIGQGAFGDVYLAKENKEGSEKYYAIKIIRRKLLKTAKSIEHLKSEFQVLSASRNPYLIKMFYSFPNSLSGFDKILTPQPKITKHDECNCIFFVMEFANGGTLKYHLNRRKKLKEEEAKFYLVEILLAISYIHEIGYIYRDLKLENILLDNQGHIKLIDFGLSKKLVDGCNSEDGETEKICGRTDTFCGTPEYLAPEVINRNSYGKSVDFWSFGVVMYALISGKYPFSSGK